jgi:hypothetical protein
VSGTVTQQGIDVGLANGMATDWRGAPEGASARGEETGAASLERDRAGGGAAPGSDRRVLQRPEASPPVGGLPRVGGLRQSVGHPFPRSVSRQSQTPYRFTVLGADGLLFM